MVITSSSGHHIAKILQLKIPLSMVFPDGAKGTPLPRLYLPLSQPCYPIKISKEKKENNSLLLSNKSMSLKILHYRATFHLTISMRGQRATGKIQRNNYHHGSCGPSLMGKASSVSLIFTHRTHRNVKNRWAKSSLYSDNVYTLRIGHTTDWFSLGTGAFVHASPPSIHSGLLTDPCRNRYIAESTVKTKTQTHFGPINIIAEPRCDWARQSLEDFWQRMREDTSTRM